MVPVLLLVSFQYSYFNMAILPYFTIFYFILYSIQLHNFSYFSVLYLIFFGFSKHASQKLLLCSLDSISMSTILCITVLKLKFIQEKEQIRSLIAKTGQV